MSIPLVCYIDEEEAEANRFIQRINRFRKIEVYYYAPDKELSLNTIKPETQLFLVDWELSALQSSGQHVGYKGGTFAARLREEFPNIPICLVTRDGILDEASRQHYVERLPFDYQITKSEFSGEPKIAVEKCLSLIDGFEMLRKSNQEWDGFVRLLKLDQDLDEESLIGEAVPPRPIAGSSDNLPSLAKWIHNVLLKYPGILYDPIHSATMLGISMADYLKPAVQEFFSTSKYTGIFNPADGRWWRNRLIKSVVELMKETTIETASLSLGFGLAFKQKFGVALEPSKCIYSEKAHADWVCYILNEPVLYEYTLAYRPDNRPPVMDDARVSFKAIKESNDIFEEYFEPTSRSIVQEMMGE